MENKKPTQFLMKPKVDFCFKELMEDEEVRNAFLAAVLGINLEEIVESRILPSHLRQKDKDDKLGILDVRVLLNNKEQIDIEIRLKMRIKQSATVHIQLILIRIEAVASRMFL
mgnify:CR=1 FL=1